MSVSNAIVVGGGIGGLACAVALAQGGVAVTLMERAARLTEIGAGLQVTPNGLAVLRALGLERALGQRGAVQGQAVVLRDGATDAQVARLDMTRLEAKQRYLFMHRADLVEVLSAAARRAGVSMELGREVASVEPGALPQVHLADGSTARAEVVIAADGIHSVARPVLNGADAPTFSGQVAWRALVPNDVGHAPEAVIRMGPGRHLVSYPLRGRRLVNLVAVEERETWAAEGWMQQSDPAELRAAFAGFGGAGARLIEAAREVTIWGLHRHPVAPVWQQQGVALLGDAAHPTLPFLAQGANLALEDAFVLARALRRDGVAGLAGYQAARIPRVTRAIAAAEANAWRYHLHPGPMRRAAHMGLRLVSTLAPGRMLGAYDWLYGHDVTRG